MDLKRLTSLTLGFIVFSLASACAAPVDDLLTALHASPQWRAADLNYQAAKLNLDAARTRAGLSLSAGGDINETRLPWDSGNWTTNGTVTLTASVNVLPWSAAQEGVRAAERALQLATVQLRQNRVTLTRQALQAYLETHMALRKVTLTEHKLILSEKNLEVAQGRRSQNMIPEDALLERQSDLESVRAEYSQAQRDAQLALQNINLLTGQAWTSAAPLPPFSPAPATLNDAELLQQALEQRPEVTQAKMSILEAQSALRSARRNVGLPDLTATLNAGQLSDGKGSTGKLLSTSFNLKSGLVSAQARIPLQDTSGLPSGISLSLSASLPLVGDTSRILVRQAEVTLLQAQLTLDTAKQAVTLDVQSRLTEVRTLQDGRAERAASLDTAKGTLKTARARLEAGRGTQVEVKQAEFNVEQAQARLDDLQDRLWAALLNLGLSTGTLDTLLKP